MGETCEVPIVETPLSDAALLVVAYEWKTLTHFGETTPALVLPGDSARWEAGRYIRYDSALTRAEWWQVKPLTKRWSCLSNPWKVARA